MHGRWRNQWGIAQDFVKPHPTCVDPSPKLVEFKPVQTLLGQSPNSVETALDLVGPGPNLVDPNPNLVRCTPSSVGTALNTGRVWSQISRWRWGRRTPTCTSGTRVGFVPERFLNTIADVRLNYLGNAPSLNEDYGPARYRRQASRVSRHQQKPAEFDRLCCSMVEPGPMLVETHLTPR